MAEGPGSADVRIKLVVDDRASETTDKLKGSLKGANEELEHGKEHSEGLGKELLKAELYVEAFKAGAELIGEGLKQAWELTERLGDAAMEAADEANQQVRASAGLMSLLDQGAHSMGDLRDYAKGVREELEQAGTKAGVSTGQMEEMFQHVIERGNRSTVQAKELTEQMAMVGKVVPGGMGSLAEGFSMMELGIVRARNPLVQLIASTGELHGNARSVAQQMMKMTPAEQIDVATRAIEKQAEKMKAGGGGMLTPTLPELKASFGNIREGFLEAVGQPMLDRIIPNLVKLRDYIIENSEVIKEYGEKIGDAIGEYVAKIAGYMSDFWNGAQQDWDAIAGNVEAAEANLSDAWGLIVGDSATVHHNLKDAAKEISEVFKTASEIIKATVETFENIGEVFENIAKGMRGIYELFAGGDWAGDLKAFGGKWGAGTDTANASMRKEDVSSKADDVGGGSSAELDAAIAKYRAWAQEAGQDMDTVDAWTTSIREHHEAVDAAAAALRDKVESGDTEYVGKYLQSAMQQHQGASELWAAQQILDSKVMSQALKDGAIDIGMGFDEFIKKVAEDSPEAAKALQKAVGSSIDPTKGIAGHGPSVNFNGGQTFNIKQDFRDQDPDRIMEVFKRDLTKQAWSRRSSRMSTAFGM